MDRVETSGIRCASPGFTLVELMIALTIGAIVLSCVCSVFISHQRIHTMHQQAVALQQNLRASMHVMEQDIHQACLDPRGSARPAILTAAAHSFAFQCDINENGHDFALTGTGDPRAAESGVDPNEHITYRLSADANQDGRADRFPCRLYRCTWNTPDALADQIDVLNFVYRDQNDAVLGPLPLNQAGRALIRSVEVTLIARTARQDPRHCDTRTYTNLQGDTLIDAPRDPYHRKTLSKVIRLRNL
ncbi:hypothetical protein JCM14469_38620 [Desulfatiferula olefinivorans]